MACEEYWCKECEHGFETPDVGEDGETLVCPWCGSDRYKDIVLEADLMMDRYDDEEAFVEDEWAFPDVVYGDEKLPDDNQPNDNQGE